MCKEETANTIPDLLDSELDGLADVPDFATSRRYFVIYSFLYYNTFLYGYQANYQE